LTPLQASFDHAERPLWSLVPQAAGDGLPAGDELALRLLRHHTKNTLQRILSEVVLIDGSRLSLESGRLLRDLERRIVLSAAISDALFGMTGAPQPMEERLRSLCKGTIELLGDADQIVRLDLAVGGECPARLRETVLRAANEMLGNAIRHGLHERMLGRITVRLVAGTRETRLTVEDDGWGFCSAREEGEGLGLTQALAEQHGGSSSIRRIGDGTRAEMILPNPRD
jgi:two-component sensor histidine kinase